MKEHKKSSDFSSMWRTGAKTRHGLKHGYLVVECASCAFKGAERWGLVQVVAWWLLCPCGREVYARLAAGGVHRFELGQRCGEGAPSMNLIR